MPHMDPSLIIKEWQASQAAHSPYLICYEHIFEFQGKSSMLYH